MKLKNSLFIALVIVFCWITDLFAEASLGLWVECQGRQSTLSSRKKIDQMLADARKMGVTDLFIQVHRGNKTWCYCSYADMTPYKTFMRKEGVDPVNYILDRTAGSSIKVHLWINTFRLLRNKDARILQELGTKIITRDGKKRLMLDYPKNNLPDGGYWLDAGDLQVQDYLLAMIREIMDKYPACAGIHLDFVRYPYRVPFYPGSQWAAGHGFGYGVDSVNRFKKQYGLDPFTMDLTRENAQLWDDWRRAQVTHFVKSVYGECKKRGKLLSTASICWADRAYLSAFQDWRGWLDDGIVDFVATMNYSIDRRFARHLSREAVCARGDKKVYVGLGAYLLTDKPKVLSGQIDDALSLGADGIVIFSYDVIKPRRNIIDLIGSKFKK